MTAGAAKRRGLALGAPAFADDYPVPRVDCSVRDGGNHWTIRPSQDGTDQRTTTRDSYSGVPYMVGFRRARDVP